jgi:hypothetical protein
MRSHPIGFSKKDTRRTTPEILGNLKLNDEDLDGFFLTGSDGSRLEDWGLRAIYRL